MDKEKIIVVGGNAAGPSAAAKAKRTLPEAEVSLFEAGSFISTGTCELPYLVSNEIKDYNKIVFFDPESFRKEKGVNVFLHHRVEYIDRKEKKILVRDLKNNEEKEYQYTKLILATGSQIKKLANLDYSLENVFGFKTVGDYLKVKDLLDSDNIKNLAIIGSGFIGLELAEAFCSTGKKVYLFEKESLPLPGADIEIQRLILELIKKNDIEFYGNSENIRFVQGDKRLKAIKFEGRTIDVDLVISAIGFEPNNILAKKSGLEISETGSIKVDSKLKTSDKNIFATGDCIDVVNEITKRKEYVPLATYAHDQGHIAGANAVGAYEYFEPIVKNIAFRIFDKAVVIVGLNSKESAKYGFNYQTFSAVAPNLVQVMPESKTVFGKILVDKNSKHFLGAQFIGEHEAVGYGNLISGLIKLKADAKILEEINYSYTPPYSPLINLLSVLGRKI